MKGKRVAEKIKKIVLAYSGGLDTSVMLHWLKETYGCEVVCYCADVGQGEELTGLEEKALKSGASKLYVEDLRQEFVERHGRDLAVQQREFGGPRRRQQVFPCREHLTEFYERRTQLLEGESHAPFGFEMSDVPRLAPL